MMFVDAEISGYRVCVRFSGEPVQDRASNEGSRTLRDTDTISDPINTLF